MSHSDHEPLPGHKLVDNDQSDDDVSGAPLIADEGTNDTGALSVNARWRRRLLRGMAVFVVVLVGYFLVSFVQVRSVGNSNQARPVDAIVVMGAAQYDGRPSPQLKARLDHVVELWQQGVASLVVVTGGNQPGDRFTEAEASAKYLTAHGVDATKIAEEDGGHSSWESLVTVADLLRERNLSRVLLVSDPYHSLRIRLIAQQLGLTAYVSPTRTSPVRGGNAVGKQLKEAAGVAVGRVIGFDRLFSLTG